eukprot:s1780_g2.t1
MEPKVSDATTTVASWAKTHCKTLAGAVPSWLRSVLLESVQWPGSKIDDMERNLKRVLKTLTRLNMFVPTWLVVSTYHRLSRPTLVSGVSGASTILGPKSVKPPTFLLANSTAKSPSTRFHSIYSRNILDATSNAQNL